MAVKKTKYTLDESVAIPVLVPPAKGFVIFGSGEPWQMNACVNVCSDSDYAYVEGYRRGAELLIEQAEQDRGNVDILVYPIVFLYRHHLELRLKEILDYLIRLGQRKLGVPKHHDIISLWNECQPVLKRISHGGDSKWFHAVYECLKQINSIDPGSDAFRYSKRKDGTKSLQGISNINLIVLREHMTKIIDWLDGVATTLTVWWDEIPKDH